MFKIAPTKATFSFLSFSLLLVSCGTQRQIQRFAQSILLNDSAIQHAHIGISVFDASAHRYLYNYNAAKYFIPASNTKIITCYAALKHLGDSIIGIRYRESDTSVLIIPEGDPTVLHPAYNRQPVIDFLKKTAKPVSISTNNWQCQPLGAGWSWDDYNEPYMAERSPLPVYGNVLHWTKTTAPRTAADSINGFDQSVSIYSIPEINWQVIFGTDTNLKSFHVQRAPEANFFTITQGTEAAKELDVPFITDGVRAAVELMKDTIGKEITPVEYPDLPPADLKIIYTQQIDSVLKPMMQQSDNFMAEQTLLMISERLLGVMNDEKIIDTLLRSTFKDLPQQPRWADGSGLSRFNLFAPLDFVFILNKLSNEFSMPRVRSLFATGGQGTLKRYFLEDSGYIFAKTGFLSGVVTLSGYLYTKKHKLLIFSILVNNFRGSATPIRRQTQAFLRSLRNRY